jgi:hypothetical protein
LGKKFGATLNGFISTFCYLFVKYDLNEFTAVL